MGNRGSNIKLPKFCPPENIERNYKRVDFWKNESDNGQFLNEENDASNVNFGFLYFVCFFQFFEFFVQNLALKERTFNLLLHEPPSRSQLRCTVQSRPRSVKNDRSSSQVRYFMFFKNFSSLKRIQVMFRYKSGT